MNKLSKLTAQANANEIYAAIMSPKSAKKLLKATKAMREECFRLTKVDESIEKMTDEKLLKALFN